MTTHSRNPMGLDDLRALLADIESTLEQIRASMPDASGDGGLLAALYTKALVVKLQVKADIERMTS